MTIRMLWMFVLLPFCEDVEVLVLLKNQELFILEWKRLELAWG